MPSKIFTSGCLHTLEDACLTGLRHIQTDPLSPVIVLVPGNLVGLHLRRRLASAEGLCGHANIRFLTLVDFARELCRKGLLQNGIPQVPPLLEQLLLHQVVASIIPEDGYFAAAKGQEVFCHSLYETVTDLKEACIRPEELNRWANAFSDPKEGGHKLKELAQIYMEYTRCFRELNFVDRSDLLDWSSRDGIGSDDFSLLIYGFYDFNPLQRNFLEAVLKKKEALIFFPWRAGPAFDYALPSLTWLKSVGCEHVPLKAVERGPVQRLALVLFDSPDGQRNEEELENPVTIISAPGERREVREIARECVRWVEEYGLKFTDIGIFLRNREPYASLFAETFTHLEIPYYLHGGRPLWKNRAGQSLRLLFNVLREDFSRSSVMEFISYAPITFERFLGETATQANPALWDLFSLKAGIVGGREEWIQRLWRLCRRIDWEEGLRKEEREGRLDRVASLTSLKAFIEFLGRFFADLERIPLGGHWSDFAGTFSNLLGKVLQPSQPTQQVRDILEGLSTFDLLNGEITLERFASVAEVALSTANEKTDGFGRTGVFIGDLMSARGLTFKAVIVPGTGEKFFPRPWRQDPILLDHERQYISEGLKKELSQKNRSYDEERLLFTLTLMAAKERILLTFPRLEPLTGREKIPSFFLLRLMEAATGQRVDFTDLEKWRAMRRVSLSRLFPSETESMDHLEYDLTQADQSLKSNVLAPLGYLSSLSPFFCRSLKAEAKRWGERSFTDFDGVLGTRKVHAHLKRLYPDKATSLSPTRLELYARCPYRFFLEVLLELAPLEEPDRFAVLSPLDRGVLIHRILFSFLSRLKSEGRFPLRRQDLNLLETALAETAEEILSEFEQDKATGFPSLWSLQKAEVLEDLKGWLRVERVEEADFLPAYLEHPFSCHFSIGKESLGLKGRIDRIDLSLDGRRARVTDYKTGRPALLEDGQFKGGEALQLPIYLYAASSLLKNAQEVEADYFYVTKKGKYRKVPFTQKEWEDKFATLQRIVGGLVDGIRKGLFIPHPSSCSARGCLYPWICSPAVDVLCGRKGQDPQIRPYARIKEIP